MFLPDLLSAEKRKRLFAVITACVLITLIGLGVFAKNGWQPSIGSIGLSGLEQVAEAAEVAHSFESASVSADAPAAAPMPQPSGIVKFDFDADGKADIGRWRASSTVFKVKNSGNGATIEQTIGTTASISAPGNFDSDEKTDMAVFTAGTWTIKKSGGGEETITFGLAGDKPFAGNFVGDSRTDVAVFRPSNSTWYIRDAGGTQTSVAWGLSGDIPVPGNYDGDDYMDLAVYRPSSPWGVWHIYSSASGIFTRTWGFPTDIPAPADYDADGKTDMAVYRPSTGTWYFLYSLNGFTTFDSRGWGLYGDQPVPADYDGDGKADLSVWRPTTGAWHTLKSGNGEYVREIFGIAGDVAVPSSYLKQSGAQVFGDAVSRARLSPKNATGGTNLYSRNFSWGTSLVNLPGRAGLNAGFGMSYNSLVWTKEGSNIHFDTNYDNISPGFRFGYATIEPVYYDTTTQKFTYLMVTPSGGRVEFRQTTVSNVYETADSSYVQLAASGASHPNEVENLTITVTGTDGSRMLYTWKGGAFRCWLVVDRNGNYIQISHDDDGLMRTVTDTLGRVITIEYDGYFQPTAIKQTWKSGNGGGSDVVHTWASFTYRNETVTTDFGSLNVFGPENSTVLRVLERVTYADLSSTRFTHNSYGQVWKVQNYAPDGTTELNYVSTNFNSPSGVQTDCPRLTSTATWAKDFNLVNGTAQAVIVTNTAPASDSFSQGSLSESSSSVKVAVTGHPDQLYSLIHFAASGWREGLTLATEDCLGADSECAERKRWTWTDWTQDNESVGYQLNPRVEESRVGDAVNVKKTSVEYRLLPSTTIAEYGLVSAVNIYDTNLSTVLKRVETDYNLATAYTDRRIIGLPSEVRVYGYENGSLPPVSRMTYVYDGENFSQEPNQNITSVIQHDNANFSAAFIIGRGNLTSTTRHDVTGQTAAVTSKVRYDIAGSPVAQLDPLDRKVSISYTDDFNSTVSGATFAYPTTITDPAGNSSTVEYRYDIGTNVWAKGPNLNTSTAGKETRRIFDSLGRLEKQLIVNTGAYTRYSRPNPDNGRQIFTHSTIIDTNANGADSADEVFSESWTDGAGRVLKSRTEHPNSTGGWSATLAEYDILGRVTKQSVPTEIDSNWNATGDDTIFRWTHQKYDWMGRVVRKINTDGDPLLPENDSDVRISYAGCGCAGGLITTIEGENIVETDWQGNNPNPLGRRKQKLYEDILGRQWKTEVLNWNGSVYSTNTVQFNGRDQAFSVTQTEQSTSVSQITSMTYDGHGRLKTQHRPEQGTGTVTTTNYNMDDSIQSVVDARGATAAYSYNSRRLVEGITYSVPSGSTIPVSPTVNFAYDNIGNRILMTDGLGTVNYLYNELSQMTAETRDFNDTLANAPTGGVFTLDYTYNLSGGLKSYKDPYGQQFNYTQDRTGRLLSTAGQTAFAGVTDYASGAEYRAWGGLKELHTGDGLHSETGYNNRLRPANFKLRKSDNSLKMDKNYGYYADGSMKKLNDLQNPVFDRIKKYDHVGRIKEGKAGVFARGESHVQGEPTAPYTKTYDYDGFGNLKGDVGGYWGYTTNTYDYTFNTQGRVTGQSYNGTNIDPSKTWQYDAEGRALRSYDELSYRGEQEFDAAGHLTKLLDYGYFAAAQHEVKTDTDGDGLGVKKRTRVYNSQTSLWEDRPTRYYVMSSVLGGDIVTEMDETGRKLETEVNASGRGIATQRIIYNESGGVVDEEVEWKNLDSFGVSDLRTRKKGQAAQVTGTDFAPMELDAAGVELQSRLTTGGGGGGGTTIDPEIPTLDPDSHEIGGLTSSDRGSYGAGGGGAGAPLCVIYGSIVVECGRVRFADGLGSSPLGALERARAMSREQVGTRTRVRELVQGRSGRPPVARNGGSGPPSNQRISADGESILLGYEWWTEPVYSNNWSVSVFINQTTRRPLTPQETRDFNSSRDRARDALRDNRRCRDAIARLLKDESFGRFLPDQTLTTRDGQTISFTPLNDFLYNASVSDERRRSGYLNEYDSVDMQGSGASGRSGNSITYGITASYRNREGLHIPGPITWNREFFNLSRDARALHTLHEILHQYADDNNLANRIAGIENDRPNGRNNPTRTFAGEGSDASEYINQYLSRVCGLPTS